MKKNKIYVAVLLYIGFIFSAFASDVSPVSKELSLDFPQHFIGLIPEANCKNQYQLDLLENKTYFLRSVCLKNGVASKANDDIGRWYVDNDDRVVLNGTKKRATYFQILDAATIELMDVK